MTGVTLQRSNEFAVLWAVVAIPAADSGVRSVLKLCVKPQEAGEAPRTFKKHGKTKFQELLI